MTPSQDGVWRSESLSPGRHVQEFVRNNENSRLSGWQWVDFEDGPYEERLKTWDTCEIYAAMYDEDGLLGGRGREIISERNSGSGKAKFEIGREFAYAMRSVSTGGKSGLMLHRIADKSTAAYQAVNLLNDFYRDMPGRQDGVDANLILTASGPADLWFERISNEPAGKGAGVNSGESSFARSEARKAITGSWRIGPYKKGTKFPQKGKLDEKTVWVFAADGTFAIKPEYDFWFTPPTIGTWKYIGDQRLEVTTKAPVRIPVDVSAAEPGSEATKISKTSHEEIGTSFIVKLAHKPNEPTEFTGFFVQNSDGNKMVWGEALHPGKSPYEMSELYSDEFLDLLGDNVSGSNTDPARKAYLERRKPEKEKEKAALAAKLAELKALSEQSQCDMGYLDSMHPGNMAFPGQVAGWPVRFKRQQEIRLEL